MVVSWVRFCLIHFEKSLWTVVCFVKIHCGILRCYHTHFNIIISGVYHKGGAIVELQRTFLPACGAQPVTKSPWVILLYTRCFAGTPQSCSIQKSSALSNLR